MAINYESQNNEKKKELFQTVAETTGANEKYAKWEQLNQCVPLEYENKNQKKKENKQWKKKTQHYTLLRDAR